MARSYKKVIFFALIIFFQVSFCRDQYLQSVKIINSADSELKYSHTLPSSSFAYIHILNTDYPRAFITSWNPGTYGNTREACKSNQDKPLSTWLRIGFNGKVLQSFIDDFFATLKTMHNVFKRINPVRYKGFKQEFVIQIQPFYTDQEIEVFIEKVNIAMYKKLLREMTGKL